MWNNPKILFTLAIIGIFLTLCFGFFSVYAYFNPRQASQIATKTMAVIGNTPAYVYNAVKGVFSVAEHKKEYTPQVKVKESPKFQAKPKTPYPQQAQPKPIEQPLAKPKVPDIQQAQPLPKYSPQATPLMSLPVSSVEAPLKGEAPERLKMTY